MVEFLALGLVLLVPVTYLVLVVFRVQAASYGLAAATREAGRAYLTAPSTDVALARADAAAQVA
ncbi:MAG: pilus assembly protein, partial [Actinomycetes bacterium]